MFRNKKGGFTLAEIAVAIVIIGVIAILALPGYQWIVQRIKNEEGKQALLNVYQSQLQYKKETGSYATVFSDLDLDYPAGSFSTFSPVEADSSSVARCTSGTAVRVGYITRTDGTYTLELLEDGTIQCTPCASSACQHFQ